MTIISIIFIVIKIIVVIIFFFFCFTYHAIRFFWLWIFRFKAFTDITFINVWRGVGRSLVGIHKKIPGIRRFSVLSKCSNQAYPGMWRWHITQLKIIHFKQFKNFKESKFFNIKISASWFNFHKNSSQCCILGVRLVPLECSKS